MYEHQQQQQLDDLYFSYWQFIKDLHFFLVYLATATHFCTQWRLAIRR